MSDEVPNTPPDEPEAEVQAEVKVAEELQATEPEVKENVEENVPTHVSAIPPAQSAFVRMRGLPFNATEKDVKEFFDDLPVEKVKFVVVHGRPNGEAYVEFKSREDATVAMGYDRKEINKRYIELFSAAASEAEFAMRPDPAGSQDENHVVRLRGIPWSCTEDDIRNFFDGLEPPPAEIVIGGTGGPNPRPSGEAFVRFSTGEASQKAMEYNKRHLGSRYVEVFQSTMVELNRSKGHTNSGPPSSYERTGIRPLMSLDRSDTGYGASGGYGNRGYGSGGGGGYEDQRYGGGQDYGSQGGYGGGGGGYDHYGGDYGGGSDPFRIYMRGLPYDADAHAIEAFFSPIRCSSVKLGINDTGRPSGDAIAEFDNYNDMVAGMARNNQRMGRRYVELFYTRDAPGPMKRLLWRETSGPNQSAAPIPDPVLSGRRGGGPPPAPRGGDSYRSGGAPPRDAWGPQRPQTQRGYEGGGGMRGGRAPRSTPRAEPWGGYGGAAQAAPVHGGYDQGYGGGHNGGWESYGSGGGAPRGGYGGVGGGAGYDRQREPRDSGSSWTQAQGAYGGWGAGDQRGGGGY
ncbi:unnamed protein product [Caenorhabditis sp. 36 PRJEB53466]|nr:unnamed protein product [Caenorhabditis sp. 36 PRJEB53466]